MRLWCFSLYLAALQFSFPALAADGSPLLRLDPSVDAIVSADARLETLFQKDSIFEGPTWVRKGSSGFLIFSDVPGNVINRLNPDRTVSVYADKIFRGKDLTEAYQSTGQTKYWMIGPNGITLDRQGRVVYAAFSDGEIVRIEKDGRRTVLASHFDGQRINAPNDLVYSSDGSLFFTDSRAGTKHADGDGVPHKGLYVLRAGKVRLLSKDIDHPNGVAFSPDGKYLYVTNTLRKNILRFEVHGEQVTNQKLFIDMSAGTGMGAPDGIKVDPRGNVYASGPGGVWIMSSDGRHIGTIATPKPITNLVFDGRFGAIYMTGQGVVYRITVKASGR